MKSKKCSNCFRVKFECEFYRKCNGLQSRCKQCNAEVVRSYAQRKRRQVLQARWDKVYARETI